jgi:hypothetical protein
MFLTKHFLHSPCSSPRLRVGVLLDSDQLIKPLADVLEHVRQSNYTELVLRVYNSAAAKAAADVSAGHVALPIRLLRIVGDPRRRQKIAWKLYNILDRRLAGVEGELLAPQDLSSFLQDVPRVDVNPIAKGFVHRFPPDAIEAIRSSRLDVLLRFGFNIIRGEILQAARYGTWSYHHGDNDYYRGGPAHFWELVEQNPLSGVMLQILTDVLDGGQVLCKGLAATAPNLLLSKNRVAPYLLGTTFVIRKLFELHRGGFTELQCKAVAVAPYAGKQKIYRAPTNWQLAKFLAPRLAGKALRRPFTRRTVDHWRIGFRVGRPMRFADGAPDLTGFRWHESPRGRFYADPFLFEKNGNIYCFFEDFDYAANRGRISCGQIEPDGSMPVIEPALEPDYHLSYPFVFEESGEIFMIPENSALGTVDLYRSTSFPLHWRKAATLLNAPGLDTTIIYRGGLYWLFTSVFEPPFASHQLVLMFSDSFLGPYQFHHNTPLSADARYARCGGRLFEQDGMLIRPAQDARGTYGSALHFLNVTELSPDGYREEPLATMRPPAGFHGTHSYDRVGVLEAIDGKEPQPFSRHIVHSRVTPPPASARRPHAT